MILVIGGRGQGKREFALQNLIPEDEGPMVRWASGRDEGWESYMRKADIAVISTCLSDVL